MWSHHLSCSDKKQSKNYGFYRGQYSERYLNLNISFTTFYGYLMMIIFQSDISRLPPVEKLKLWSLKE